MSRWQKGKKTKGKSDLSRTTGEQMQAQRKHYQGFKDQRDKLQDKHYRAFF